MDKNHWDNVKNLTPEVNITNYTVWQLVGDPLSRAITLLESYDLMADSIGFTQEGIEVYPEPDYRLPKNISNPLFKFEPGVYDQACALSKGPKVPFPEPQKVIPPQDILAELEHIETAMFSSGTGNGQQVFLSTSSYTKLRSYSGERFQANSSMDLLRQGFHGTFSSFKDSEDKRDIFVIKEIAPGEVFLSPVGVRVTSRQFRAREYPEAILAEAVTAHLRKLYADRADLAKRLEDDTQRIYAYAEHLVAKVIADPNFKDLTIHEVEAQVRVLAELPLDENPGKGMRRIPGWGPSALTEDSGILGPRRWGA